MKKWISRHNALAAVSTVTAAAMLTRLRWCCIFLCCVLCRISGRFCRILR